MATARGLRSRRRVPLRGRRAGEGGRRRRTRPWMAGRKSGRHDADHRSGGALSAWARSERASCPGTLTRGISRSVSDAAGYQSRSACRWFFECSKPGLVTLAQRISLSFVQQAGDPRAARPSAPLSPRRGKAPTRFGVAELRRALAVFRAFARMRRIVDNSAFSRKILWEVSALFPCCSFLMFSGERPSSMLGGGSFRVGGAPSA